MSKDRNELLELLARYVSIPDTKNFDDLPRSVLTDPFIFDFESLGAPPAVEEPLADVMARTRPVFEGFQATHHVASSPRITIEGDTAHMRSHIRAEHWLAPELAPPNSSNCWLVVGFYDDDCVRTSQGWRIYRKKLTLTYQENYHIRGLALAEGQRILGQ